MISRAEDCKARAGDGPTRNRLGEGTPRLCFGAQETDRDGFCRASPEFEEDWKSDTCEGADASYISKYAKFLGSLAISTCALGENPEIAGHVTLLRVF